MTLFSVELLKAITRAGTAGARAGASYVASHAAGAAVSSLIATAENPASRLLAYTANNVTPDLVIPPEACLRLIHGGLVPEDVARQMLRYNGINWPAGNELHSSNQAAWRKWVDISAPTFEPDLIRKWLRQGRVQRSDLYVNLQQHGLHPSKWFDLFTGDTELLDAGAVVTARLKGVIGEVVYYERLLQLGIPQRDADILWAVAQAYPEAGDVLTLLNRQTIPLDTARRYLAAAGFTDQAVQDQVLELRKQIPGPSDLVFIGVKDAWDDAVALRFGYDQEFPAQLGYWLDRQGLGYSGDVPDANGNARADLTWAKLHWRAHWRNIDLSSAFEMHRRLRGDPDDPGTWSDFNTPPFTDADLEAVLKINDYPPAIRERLIALNKRVLSQRQLLTIQRNNPQEWDWVEERLKDNGYDDRTAAIMMQTLRNQIDHPEFAYIDELRKKARKHFFDLIIRGYKVGSIQKPAAVTLLFNNQVPLDLAQMMVDQAEIELQTDVMKTVQQRARSDFFSGRTDANGVRQRLLSTRMDPSRVEQVIVTWILQFGEGRRHLATGKIQSMLRKGFISYDEALQRLDNLGWARPDELLLLAEVEADVAKDAAAAAKAESVKGAREVAAYEKARKQNQASMDKILARLKSLTPPAKIMQWVRDGLWTRQKAIDRLGLLGYDPQTINTMVAEAERAEVGGPTTETKRAEVIAKNLSRLTPANSVVKWYKDGTWTRDKAAARLLLLGFDPDTTETMLKDVDLTKKPPKGNAGGQQQQGGGAPGPTAP